MVNILSHGLEPVNENSSFLKTQSSPDAQCILTRRQHRMWWCVCACVPVCIIPWMYSALSHVPLWKLQLCRTLCYEMPTSYLRENEGNLRKSSHSYCAQNEAKTVPV